jgi:predicted DNA-binding ribbon-helix-helix protein
MKRTATAQRCARVERLLREDAGDGAGVLAGPLSAVIGNQSYTRPQAIEVESIARDAAISWPARRVAALVLETLLSRIGAREDRERRFWTGRFGMTDSAELAREGYRTGQPLETQVWQRLERLGRIHRLTTSARVTDRALRDFLRAARSECRLTFARYLWTSEEVIARIEHDVRRSTGMRDVARHGRYLDEAARAMEGLPAMERAIVEHLGRDAVIRWAAMTTTSAINSLVEQPVDTVVLTVKPPGSTHEIEIKRAGLVRQLPLEVIWARDNYIVPSSHHLDGGAMHQLLMFEAENSAFLSHVFRAVHGADAAMSRTLYLATVSGISTPRGEAHILDYFTEPAVFGENYERMRWNMYQVVKTLAGYSDDPFEEPINDLALTGHFIGRVKPAQAVQLGTTAFRLERIERYLSPSGPDIYFRKGRHFKYDADDARRFADEILDEVLGQYEPPRVRWRSHRQYVKAAFRVPANRKRATESYFSVLEQLGRFWGTLLAIRGHTQGESFVARNAGLRSVWRDGRWQVEIVFMDHDSLSFASVGTAQYRPRDSVNNASKDGKHIFGGSYGRSYRVRGEFWFLRRIYRVGSMLERRGIAAFRAALKNAYHRTHEAMRTNPELTPLFHEHFVEKIRHWDDLVSSYLATPKTRSARAAWKASSHTLLARRGYARDLADEHVNTVTRHAKFLRRLSFLF